MKNLIAEALNFYVCSIVGIFGIIFAVKLVFGLGKKSSIDVLWWIIFQWISIIHQVYASILFLEVFEDSSDNKNLKNLTVIFISFYLTLEIYFFYSMCLIFSSIRDYENFAIKLIGPEKKRSDNARLPTYEEAMASEA